MMEQHDVIIIGGGPAGLAAAVALFQAGIRDVLILEREKQLGGILRQCIHDGFGLMRFGETLSGPEYAKKFIDEVNRLEIPYRVNASVIHVTNDKVVTVVSPEKLGKIHAKAVIFAMGCRERTHGAIGIPGERPSGVYTAGVAQAYMNLYNRMVGREVVILGSGDIGMIMARRLTLEGAHVQAVFEIQPIPSGLPRNIEQCLNDYGIPLYLNHTIVAIHGSDRVSGVTVAQVDSHMKPIAGTEKEYACDTVILSIGLIPENELTKEAGIDLDPRTGGACVDESLQTNQPGFFAAGNVLHVHDLVDFVSQEAETVAGEVIQYLQNAALPACKIHVYAGKNVGHVLPQKVSGTKPVELSLRPNCKLTNATLTARQGDKILGEKKLRKALPAEMLHLRISCPDSGDHTEIEVSIQ